MGNFRVSRILRVETCLVQCPRGLGLIENISCTGKEAEEGEKCRKGNGRVPKTNYFRIAP